MKRVTAILLATQMLLMSICVSCTDEGNTTNDLNGEGKASQNEQKENEVISVCTKEEIAFNKQISAIITGYSVQTEDELCQEMMGYNDEEYEGLKQDTWVYDKCMELVHIELPEDHVRVKVYMTVTNTGDAELSLQPFSGEEDEDTPMPKVYLVSPDFRAELVFRAGFWGTDGELIYEESPDKLLENGTAEAQIEVAILETEISNLQEYTLRFESEGKVFEWAFDNQVEAK